MRVALPAEQTRTNTYQEDGAELLSIEVIQRDREETQCNHLGGKNGCNIKTLSCLR
ncbi:hypothetical protein HEAR3463 [Herminiimonas arsenicoxydans]|uniref:Uncharacterized protein n=1 Tax=Herminiimonas arsenicoxydans TaxID=204773 RepID=A4GAM7_HERAR|nr:hypothetical protein HEAR3463 [Herminiimonas arsenicoxydans]